MINSQLKELLEIAKIAAESGGALLRHRFSQPRHIHYKSRIDLVTDADKASEEVIIQTLHREYPTHAILAEEEGNIGQSPHRWVIDPLDGTTNYAHGVPHFCISIAYEYQGDTQIGVIYEPLRGDFFTVIKGHGAFCNDAKIKTSSTSDLSHALIATGFPYWVQERPAQVMDLFAAFAKKVQGLRRFGSAALDLAYVAYGRFDGFFEVGLKPWDYAAGLLLVQEAHGKSIFFRLHSSNTDDQGNIIVSGVQLFDFLKQTAEQSGVVSDFY